MVAQLRIWWPGLVGPWARGSDFFFLRLCRFGPFGGLELVGLWARGPEKFFFSGYAALALEYLISTSKFLIHAIFNSDDWRPLKIKAPGGRNNTCDF